MAPIDKTGAAPCEGELVGATQCVGLALVVGRGVVGLFEGAALGFFDEGETLGNSDEGAALGRRVVGGVGAFVGAMDGGHF